MVFYSELNRISEKLFDRKSGCGIELEFWVGHIEVGGRAYDLIQFEKEAGGHAFDVLKVDSYRVLT